MEQVNSAKTHSCAWVHPLPTCNGENSVEAAVSVRQLQPVTQLNLMSLAPGKVHQGATNVAAQLEHFPVDVKILAIATA